MSVTCFLASGKILDLFWQAAEYGSFAEFDRDAKSRNGLNPQVMRKIDAALKGCKIKTLHDGRWKKCKLLGPPASEYRFDFEGRNISVAEYFQERYNFILDFPYLPTVNIGSKDRPNLVPAELVLVPGGQNRSGKVKGPMTAQMIKLAAARPDDRMRFLTEAARSGSDGGIVSVLRSDPNAQSFGIGPIDPNPIAVYARLLPQAKLLYGRMNIHDPKLNGTWNLENKEFYNGPPHDEVNYCILIVSQGRPPADYQTKILNFNRQVAEEARRTGFILKSISEPHVASEDSHEISRKLKEMKEHSASIVFVVMMGEIYAVVKYVGDSLGLVTQCVRWKNVDRPPQGLYSNILMKVNTKLGGTNHTLIQRAPHTGAKLFQEPPNSLSWVLNEPCIFIGVDCSHPDPGSDKPSIAALVGSLDGQCSQYVARISAQRGKQEIIESFEDSLKRILEVFITRNGRLPRHMIIYRDGVSDSQFSNILDNELPAIQGALSLLGYHRDDMKVSIIICQKNHHTRLLYEENVGGRQTYVNPAPGIVMDASAGATSINSSVISTYY